MLRLAVEKIDGGCTRREGDEKRIASPVPPNHKVQNSRLINTHTLLLIILYKKNNIMMRQRVTTAE
jgi:hypothetical protein